MDILALLQCLKPTITKTRLRQCSRIVAALLVMTGRVTMLGLARWAGPGGSYRDCTGKLHDPDTPTCRWNSVLSLAIIDKMTNWSKGAKRWRRE